MSKAREIILLAIVLLIPSICTAEEIGLDSTQTDTELNTPERLEVQKRFFNRSGYDMFPQKASQHLYLGAGGGIMGMSDRVDIIASPTVSAYIGYRFNPIHSLRLDFSYASLQTKQNCNFNANSYAFGVSYLASISDFVNGYNPKRVVNFSTILGIGARLAKYETGSKISPYLYAGLHVDFNFDSRTSLFLEPYVGFTSPQNQLFQNNSAAGLNATYGITAGIQYRLEPLLHGIKTADPSYSKWFLDFTQGWYMPYKSGFATSRSGIQSQLSVGRCLTPVLGVRLGINASEFYHSAQSITSGDIPIGKTRYCSQHTAAARFEIMLDILNMFPRFRQHDHWFDLDLLAGASIGESVKDNSIREERIVGSFWGATAALQALFRISQDSWLLLEPRYERMGYFLPKGHNDDDQAFIFSLGSRLYRSSKSERQKNAVGYSNTLWSIHNMWIGASVGGVINYHGSEDKTTNRGIVISPAAGISVGYNLCRWAGARFDISYQRNAFQNERYHSIDLRVGYMLPVSDVWQGVNPKRRFNAYGSIGPVIPIAFNNGHKVGVGIWGSLMGSYSITKHWDLFIEPMLQYNIKNVHSGNGQKSDHVRISTSLGTHFHF